MFQNKWSRKMVIFFVILFILVGIVFLVSSLYDMPHLCQGATQLQYNIYEAPNKKAVAVIVSGEDEGYINAMQLTEILVEGYFAVWQKYNVKQTYPIIVPYFPGGNSGGSYTKALFFDLEPLAEEEGLPAEVSK